MKSELNEIKPVWKFVIHSFMAVLCVCFVLPLLIVASVSFSDSIQLVKSGYGIFPKGFTLKAYQYIFMNPGTLLRSYLVTIGITAAGCVAGLIVNALYAYPLSRRSFKYRKIMNVYMVIIMFFNGGLVPTYILITQYLHGKDTLWVMIIPALCVPWYIIILRIYFSGIPESVVESAFIDGANEMRIFMSIIVPLSKPAMATVALFMALGYWNEWYTALLYISSASLYPLQYLLYKYMAQAQAMTKLLTMGIASIDASQEVPTEPLRMAMCILAAGPMLFIFPFFQKYFVKGLTLGSVKG